MVLAAGVEAAADLDVKPANGLVQLRAARQQAASQFRRESAG